MENDRLLLRFDLETTRDEEQHEQTSHHVFDDGKAARQRFRQRLRPAVHGRGWRGRKIFLVVAHAGHFAGLLVSEPLNKLNGTVRESKTNVERSFKEVSIASRLSRKVASSGFCWN